jgi:importin-7
VKIQWQNKKTFASALQGVIQCIQDKELPVKIEAAATLSEMIKAKICNDELEPVLGDILKAYLGLMNEIENEYIVSSLDLIIETFGPKMKPYALDICTTLSDKFITILKEFPEMDDEEQEANSAIAYTCLVSIQTILDSISSHQDLLAKIEPKLLTLIAFVLESENLDYLEEGTKIFTFISFYQSNISTDMWKLYDMSFFAFDKWAYDFGECKEKKFTHRFFTSF